LCLIVADVLLNVESKCGIHKSVHKCSDKDASAPSSANEGVTVETVDKSVIFPLKKSKDKTKIDRTLLAKDLTNARNRTK